MGIEKKKGNIIASYQLIDSKHTQTALFTGDTIFLGEVGRPDLAVNSTTSKEELAKLLFNSI